MTHQLTAAPNHLFLAAPYPSFRRIDMMPVSAVDQAVQHGIQAWVNFDAGKTDHPGVEEFASDVREEIAALLPLYMRKPFAVRTITSGTALLATDRYAGEPYYQRAFNDAILELGALGLSARSIEDTSFRLRMEYALTRKPANSLVWLAGLITANTRT